MKQKNHKISISPLAITTTAESDLPSLLKKIENNTVGPRIDNKWYGQAPGKTKSTPIYTAEIAECNDNSPCKKIANILNITLSKLPRELDKKENLIFTLLPPKHSTRSKFFCKKTLTTTIRSKYSKTAIDFSHTENSVCSILNHLCKKIGNNNYKNILFGGIDSLINTATIQELNSQHRLMTKQCTTGIAPGEGCAYILLQHLKGKNPHLAKIDNKTPQVYDSYLETIDEVILSLGAESEDPIRWYQITQELWTKTAPKELATCFSVGEIGAATIPLSLAIAYAKLQYLRQKKVLIYEANNEYSAEGTILLEV